MPLDLNPHAIDPTAYKTLLTTSEYTRGVEIPANLKHLIDIRVSQINGCAFCLNMHIKEARQGGEVEQRIDLAAVWRETKIYSPLERSALDLAERVTKLSEGEISNELGEELRKHFSEKQIVQLLMVIININSWNRLSASCGVQPPTQ